MKLGNVRFNMLSFFSPAGLTFFIRNFEIMLQMTRLIFGTFELFQVVIMSPGRACNPIADCSLWICTWRAGKPYYRGRSRLYRSRFLRINTHSKALAETYTIHYFAQLVNLNFLSNLNYVFPKLCSLLTKISLDFVELC